jgi:hypothetical protein
MYSAALVLWLRSQRASEVAREASMAQSRESRGTSTRWTGTALALAALLLAISVLTAVQSGALSLRQTPWSSYRAGAEMARAERGWERLLAVGYVAALHETGRPHARQTYLAALKTAERKRSVEGVVRVAQAFASLGDREVAIHCLRIAARVAAYHHDDAAMATVRLASQQLVDVRDRPLR